MFGCVTQIGWCYLAVGQTVTTSRSYLSTHKDRDLWSKSSGLQAGVESDFYGQGPSSLTLLQINGSIVDLHKTNSEESKKLELANGDRAITRTLGLSVGQQIGILTTLSVNATYSQTESLEGKIFGASVQRWIIEDMLRIYLGASTNDSDQKSKSFADYDGKRVVTPDKVKGQNRSLGLTDAFGEDTILMMDGSRTTRSDRPASWSMSSQVRQYIPSTLSALHLTASHYENIGSIRPVTTYGEVLANALQAEWQQKFAKQYIGVFGYRSYVERENPRGDASKDKILGSDFVYLSGRWRQETSWAYRSNELSFSYGHFFNNQGIKGDVLTLGVDWMIR